MKIASAILVTLICVRLYASDKVCTVEAGADFNNIAKADTMKLKITIGANYFTATLSNNATVSAFKTKLPMSINMTELNGNEKYFDLPGSFPSNATKPKTIQTGELMLYGSNTLVLFYKTFSTPYSYTRIGYIDNTSGLAAALGSGNVSVKFELE